MYIFIASVQTDVRTVRRTEMLKREREEKAWQENRGFRDSIAVFLGKQ